MKTFLALLLYLVLSIFTVTRATKPVNTPVQSARCAQKNSTRQGANAQTLLDDEKDQDVPSNNDDNMVGGVDDNGDTVNDNDGGGAPGDQDTGENDAGHDEGAVDGGGDEGE